MLLSLEGLDGSGKSTAIDVINEHYYDVVLTSEPSDLEYGQLIRRNLSQDTDPLIDFYLFMADRRDHIQQTIEPALDENKFVVSDRYADSTRAYQPVALTGESSEKPFDSQWEAKTFIEQTMAPWNREPDLTLYIDVSPETAIERSSEDEKYEKLQFLESVRENYTALAESNNNIITIDGEQSKQGVRLAVLEAIDSHMI